MFFITNPHDEKPLTDNNLKNYLISNNLDYTNLNILERKTLLIKPLLIEDFSSLKGDDAFISLITCANYFTPHEITEKDLYDLSKQIYARIYEKPSPSGKIVPSFIESIYDEILKYYNIPHFSPRTKYINNIGFNFKKIKTIIDQGTPIILTMLSDGRNYYKNHSVVVFGYTVFEMKPVYSSLLDKDKKINILMVYDGWSKSVRYIDLKLINPISCIVY